MVEKKEGVGIMAGFDPARSLQFVLACVSREIKAKGFIKKSSPQDFISGLFFSMDLSLTGWKKNATTTFSGISTFLDKFSSVLVTLLRLVFISQKGCA